MNVAKYIESETFRARSITECFAVFFLRVVPEFGTSDILRQILNSIYKHLPD